MDIGFPVMFSVKYTGSGVGGRGCGVGGEIDITKSTDISALYY
jgi:hypothetical protein